MCTVRVCFNLLITPVYFEIVFAIESVCECPLHMFVEYDTKKFEIINNFYFFIYSSNFWGIYHVSVAIWNTVILVYDVFISNLFCVSQVTIRESSSVNVMRDSGYFRVVCIMKSIVSTV